MRCWHVALAPSWFAQMIWVTRMCVAKVESATFELAASRLAHVDERSEVLDMTPDDYVDLCLCVCEQLPTGLIFCIADGVPVRFSAEAYVGDCVE